MQHYSKLETCPFRGPFLINKNDTREHTIQIKHKHGYRPKEFNNDTDTSGSGSPKSTFQHYQTKVNSVQFNDIYDYINTRDTNNEPTPLINTTDERLTEEIEVQGEEYFEDLHEPEIPEENSDHIYPKLNNNSPSPTMNSGVIDMYHHDTDTFIYDPQEFFQYCS